jgi:serine/threonine protein phosphatase PrpC
VAGCVLGVVADGMGGRSGGRKAVRPGHDDGQGSCSTATRPSTTTRLDPEADRAGGAPGDQADRRSRPEQEPHSTIVAFLINPTGECHWIHAGDSRIYHFNGTKLVKRTMDHSYVQTLVDRGELTEDEANVHPQSNILMGCLGAEDDPPMDLHFIEQLRPGDILMACSDGVWHYFSSSELGSVLSSLSPREATEFLIEKARSRATAAATTCR